MATKGSLKSSEQSAASVTDENSNSGLRKPVFVKVDSLQPGTNGHTLIVKILSSNTVLSKKPRNTMSFRGSQNQNTRIAECLIGDETGTILFTARNNQGPFATLSFTQNRVLIYIFLGVTVSC